MFLWTTRVPTPPFPKEVHVRQCPYQLDEDRASNGVRVFGDGQREGVVRNRDQRIAGLLRLPARNVNKTLLIVTNPPGGYTD